MRAYPALAVFSLIILAAGPAWAGDDLHALVREGRTLFEAGQFGEAQEKFASAELLAPEDARVAYNRARAYQAAGEAEKAQEYYRKASLAVDAELSPRIAFNRGALDVAKARELLGEDPVAVVGETRDEVLDLFKSAVRHYRGVAEWGGDDRDARYNIELIRVFVKDLRDRWRKADREKARNETDLLRYLEYLMGQQEILRDATEAIESNRTDQRHAVRLEEIRIVQGELVDEMPHLRDKVKQRVAELGQASPHPSAPGGAAPAPDPKQAEMLQQAEKQLLDLVDRVETGMETAVRALAAVKLAAAHSAQRAAHDHLLDMWKGLADFGSLLRRAIREEDGVVARAEPLAADAGGRDEEVAKKLSARLVGDQRRVRDLVPLLERRARQGVEQLGSAPAGPVAGAPGPAGAAGAGGPDPAKTKEALDKALALLPAADKAMDGAVVSFEDRAWPGGLEKAKEAARILREIAKLLQNQNQQKQDSKQDQQQQDQHEQDQQQQDAQKNDRQQQEQQQQMSREDAERQLRKMRENRNKREKRRREAAGGRRIRVEKDW